MISNEAIQRAEQLVQDIFLQIRNSEVHREVREDPEAYLLSLLSTIKTELSGYRKYRATLHSTVESASFQSHLEKAREELPQPVSNE
jgi:DNA-directed RNA polymerase specialized sigma24 family protein